MTDIEKQIEEFFGKPQKDEKKERPSNKLTVRDGEIVEVDCE